MLKGNKRQILKGGMKHQQQQQPKRVKNKNQ